MLQWFPHNLEWTPWRFRSVTPPPETDIIHVNSWHASGFLHHPLPVVTTVHHLVHDPRFRPYRSLAQATYHNFFIRPKELKAIQNSAAVNTVSHYVRDTVIDFSGRNDIRVIYNWMPDDEIKLTKSERRSTSEEFRLLIVGAHSRRKGRDLLAVLLSELDSGMALTIVGLSAEEARHIRSDRVRFCGKLTQQELFDEYAECDVVVSLSRYEGFGYSLLEAAHFSKPVIAFNTSAIPEVVAHMDTGILVPVDRIDLVIEAARLLKKNLAQYVNFSAKARSVVQEKFREDDLIRQYVALYKETLDGRKD